MDARQKTGLEGMRVRVGRIEIAIFVKAISFWIEGASLALFGYWRMMLDNIINICDYICVLLWPDCNPAMFHADNFRPLAINSFCLVYRYATDTCRTYAYFGMF